MASPTDITAPPPVDEQTARRLQKRYASRRRRWALVVGRPYPQDRPDLEPGDHDLRPPPGEIDAEPDE